LAKNEQERTIYGQTHIEKTIDNFWQYIIFSDEAHYDADSQVQGTILRELGTRYEPENIQQRGKRGTNCLHFAAWINWHTKAKELVFYNDEKEYIQKPTRPPKPRRTMYQTDDKYYYYILE
jgi:hypothetical protein